MAMLLGFAGGGDGRCAHVAGVGTCSLATLQSDRKTLHPHSATLCRMQVGWGDFSCSSNELAKLEAATKDYT